MAMSSSVDVELYVNIERFMFVNLLHESVFAHDCYMIISKKLKIFSFFLFKVT